MTTIGPKGHQGGSITLLNSSVNMEVESSYEMLTILPHIVNNQKQDPLSI